MTCLLVLGMSYRTAPLSVRERLAFTMSEIELAYARLLKITGIQSLVLLNTCHRIECYVELSEGVDSTHLLDWFVEQGGFESRAALQPYLYQYRQAAAVRHLLSVSAGLDSLVLGENQILGQLKLAYEQARAVGRLTRRLARWFQYSFGVAKRIRTETGLGKASLSLASVAFKWIAKEYDASQPVSILFLGSGEMIRLAAKHARSFPYHQLCFSNRTAEKAAYLAKTFGGQTCLVESIGDKLSEVDVLITATASPKPLVSIQTVANALKKREQKSPLLLIDLAMPRDIDPMVATLPGVQLYGLDDLQTVVADNKKTREFAAQQAQLQLERHIEAFMAWLAVEHDIRKDIQAYRQQCIDLTDKTLAEALRQLDKGQAPHLVLENLAYKLSKRLMHHPMRLLKKDRLYARQEKREQTLESLIWL